MIIDIYSFPFVINEVEAALAALAEEVSQSDISVDSAYEVLTNYPEGVTRRSESVAV